MPSITRGLSLWLLRCKAILFTPLSGSACTRTHSSQVKSLLHPDPAVSVRVRFFSSSAKRFVSVALSLPCPPLSLIPSLLSSSVLTVRATAWFVVYMWVALLQAGDKQQLVRRLLSVSTSTTWSHTPVSKSYHITDVSYPSAHAQKFPPDSGTITTVWLIVFVTLCRRQCCLTLTKTMIIMVIKLNTLPAPTEMVPERLGHAKYRAQSYTYQIKQSLRMELNIAKQILPLQSMATPRIPLSDCSLTRINTCTFSLSHPFRLCLALSQWGRRSPTISWDLLWGFCLLNGSFSWPSFPCCNKLAHGQILCVI